MQRVVEPELMDEDQQARAYSEADFAVPHDRFVELLAASTKNVKGPLLDLGCGPADVTVRVAKRFPKVEVIHGVDGSAAMLRYGNERVAKEGLSARVKLVQAMLPKDKPPLAKYPVVISNSLLHHLHDPQGLWKTVKTYASGHVFVMDLMRPDSAADVDALVEEHSKGEPDVLVRDFRASLCAAFTADEVRAQLREAGLTKLRVDVVSDRHLTVSGPAS